MFHVVGHRDEHRAARYFAQIAQQGGKTGTASVREAVESLANMLADAGSTREAGAIREWLAALIRNPDHGFCSHVVAFVVFRLDAVLEQDRSLCADTTREILLRACHAATLEEYEKSRPGRGKPRSDRSVRAPGARARIEAIDGELDLLQTRVMSGFSAVIMQRLADLLRSRDPDAAREANRLALRYSTEFDNAQFGRVHARPSVSDASLFRDMVAELNSNSIYLLPSLAALFREGEFLLAKRSYREALETLVAVEKGVGKLWGGFDPASTKLAAAGRILTGETFLGLGEPEKAVENLCQGRDLLEDKLEEIAANEALIESVTVRAGSDLQDIMRQIQAGPRMRIASWPNVSDWKYLIAVARRRAGRAWLAAGNRERAGSEFHTAERILSELLPGDPGNAAYQYSLALVQLDAARGLADAQNWPAAEESARAGCAMLGLLLKRRTDDPGLQRLAARAAILKEQIHTRKGNPGKNGPGTPWPTVAEARTDDGTLSDETGGVWAQNCAQYEFTVMASIQRNDLELPADTQSLPIVQVERRVPPDPPRAFHTVALAPSDLTRTQPRDEVSSCRQLLASGRTQEAIDGLRRILFPNDSLSMRDNAPVDARIEFATALILAQNSEGAEECLAGLEGVDHPRVAALRKLLHGWQASLSTLQRLGIRRKPPLPRPPLENP
ncbi:MAG: hypothetical protein U1F77_00225 [Kiritimatiellia bacterium]